jgi:hypothetical protein
MTPHGPTGRLKTGQTVRREVRRVLNVHAPQIAEKLLAKALQGDTDALAAAANMLIDANKPELPK